MCCHTCLKLMTHSQETCTRNSHTNFLHWTLIQVCQFLYKKLSTTNIGDQSHFSVVVTCLFLNRIEPCSVQHQKILYKKKLAEETTGDLCVSCTFLVLVNLYKILDSVSFCHFTFVLPLGVLQHSSSCCCSNTHEGTLLLCISVYAVSVDVLMHAVDLHKTASVSGLWIHDV